MKLTIIKSCLARFSGIFAAGTPSNIHGTAISYRCAKFGAFVNSVTILTLRDLTIVISMLHKRKWSWQLRTWSHKMNLLHTLITTLLHYSYRDLRRATYKMLILILMFTAFKLYDSTSRRIILHFSWFRIIRIKWKPKFFGKLIMKTNSDEQNQSKQKTRKRT